MTDTAIAISNDLRQLSELGLPDVELLEDDDLADVIARAAQARKVLADYEKAGKAEIKDRLDSGAKLPLWYVDQRAGKTEVPDIAALFAWCHEEGIDRDTFLACCSVSIPQLASAYADAHPEQTKKDATAECRYRIKREGLTAEGEPSRFAARTDA
jgi:hypothetical protein